MTFGLRRLRILPRKKGLLLMGNPYVSFFLEWLVQQVISSVAEPIASFSQGAFGGFSLRNMARWLCRIYQKMSAQI